MKIENRYIYFRKSKKNNTEGTICIGYNLDQEKSVATLAFTFCMPQKDRFSRKEAHDILGTRLNDPTKRIAIDFVKKVPTYKDMVEVAIKLMTATVNNEIVIPNVYIPSWAKKFVKDGLITEKN